MGAVLGICWRTLPEEVRDKLIIVLVAGMQPTSYQETGILRFVHNPDPIGAPDLAGGVKAITSYAGLRNDLNMLPMKCCPELSISYERCAYNAAARSI